MPELSAVPLPPAHSRSASIARRALLAAVTIALAAILGYLYLKTEGADFKHQNEVLAALRELKEIDSRWDVDILRAHTELAPPEAAPPDHGATVARILRDLTATGAALGGRFVPTPASSTPGNSRTRRTSSRTNGAREPAQTLADLDLFQGRLAGRSLALEHRWRAEVLRQVGRAEEATEFAEIARDRFERRQVPQLDSQPMIRFVDRCHDYLDLP